MPTGLPGATLLKRVLARQKKKPGAMLRVGAANGAIPVEPVVPEAMLAGGGLVRWLALDMDAPVFQIHQQLRLALAGLLAEQPAHKARKELKALLVLAEQPVRKGRKGLKAQLALAERPAHKARKGLKA